MTWRSKSTLSTLPLLGRLTPARTGVARSSGKAAAAQTDRNRVMLAACILDPPGGRRPPCTAGGRRQVSGGQNKERSVRRHRRRGRDGRGRPPTFSSSSRLTRVKGGRNGIRK